jgi:hypothetical protein
MARTLEIKALEKEGKSLRVKMYLVHADETEFYDFPTYALQIIWDKREGSISQAISIDDILDLDWLSMKSIDFIDSCRILVEKNLPVSEKHFDATLPYELRPQCEMEIVVKDEKWIDHIEVGKTWDKAPMII